MPPIACTFYRTVVRTFAPVAVALLAACGSSSLVVGGSDGGAADLATAGDFASADLATPPDLAGPAPDGSFGGLSCSGAHPRFATEVHPILAGCGGEMCHGGLATGAWPYASLVGARVAQPNDCDPSALLVVPRSLAGSYLIHKLTGQGICPGTSPMPRLGQLLAASDLQTIADWICTGANND